MARTERATEWQPDGYMTPAEFAGLSSRAHHAVWAAADAGLIDTAASCEPAPRRFRRDQVEALLKAEGIAT